MAMHGRPLLREDRASSLRFNVLLNPPDVGRGTSKRFAAEYMLMCNRKRISDHLLLSTSAKDSDSSSFFFMGIGDYDIWEKGAARNPASGRHAHSPRAREVALRPLSQYLPPLSPRITQISPGPLSPELDRLFVLGFAPLGSRIPQHWLSGVLSAICSVTITTTARPPRNLVT